MKTVEVMLIYGKDKQSKHLDVYMETKRTQRKSKARTR